MDLLLDSPTLLTIAIFVARVLDVSLGTVRSILVFRGHPVTAALLGFLEVLIWLVAAGQVIQNLDRWYLAVAYAAGFAAGNYAGVLIESRLALGHELVRAISSNRDIALGTRLRKLGFDVTEIDGSGKDGHPVEVLLIPERRRRVPQLLAAMSENDPEAVWTVSDIKTRPLGPRRRRRLWGPTVVRALRK